MPRVVPALLGLFVVSMTAGVSAQDAAPAAAVVRAGSAEEGRRVFLPCRSCHQIGPEARNQIGPVLNGLFGRRAGHVAGYSYSAGNRGSGIVWSENEFRDYIRDPKAKVPGTKMIFAGIKDDRKVDDLIAFLHTFDGAPVELVP